MDSFIEIYRLSTILIGKCVQAFALVICVSIAKDAYLGKKK